MTRFLKSLETLTGKLIFTVGTLLFGGSLLFGFFYFKYQEKVILGNIEEHARFSSDLARRGLHHGMLNADQEDIQKSLDILGSADDVLGIRIYDTGGRIAHSFDSTETGRVAERGSKVFEYLGGEQSPPVITTSPSGEKVLRHYIPIPNETSCYTAPCHYHGRDEEILGVLQTDFSASATETARRRMFGGTLVLGGVFVLLISAFLSAIIYNLVTRPVTMLEEGMNRLAKGVLDQPININTGDEMGLLARSFNSMAEDIRLYRERIENWNRELEKEVQKKAVEILNAQEQLINAEKLASLGRLSAGVAHELNSPLTGVVTFSHLMRERTPPENRQDLEDLDVIIEQANRCSRIIKELLGFARKDISEKAEVDINALVEGSISMVSKQSRFRNINITFGLDDNLPLVTADPNQLRQVVLNIFTNAADAMDDRGEFNIYTRMAVLEDRRFVEIVFTDTGPGIPPEHLGKVFEPFFTTKPVGTGTGLGLPVSYGIIKRHGGDILVSSDAGKGTSFTVRLPLDVPKTDDLKEAVHAGD
jgi:two-component system NtrC family sensor kinase